MNYIGVQYLFLIIAIYLSCSIQLISCVSGTTFQWNNNNNANIDTPQWHRSSHQNSAVCVDIPSNVTLCEGIGYTKMRLPNLLNHDSLSEVSQQAVSWVPLSQLNCHPDTQLFLCSLFCPVCLDHPIPPCRSLCQSVKTSCEHVMLNYGYPWPKIVECSQFPIDNDMCIQAQHSPPVSSQSLADKKPITTNQHTENKHRKGGHNRKGSHHNQGKKQRRYQPTDAYQPPAKETVYEPQPGHLQSPSQLDSETRMKEEPQVDQVLVTGNDRTTERPARKWSKDQRQLYNDIISNFCRSQWILKARLYPVIANKNELKVRNYRLIHGSLQPTQAPVVLSANTTVIQKIQNASDDQTATGADGQQKQRRYFIIGKTEPATGANWVTYVMQWPHKSAQLRKAIKAITNGDYDCNRQDNSEHTSAADRPSQRAANNEPNNQETRDRDGKGGHNNHNNQRRNNRKDKKRVVSPQTS